MNIHFFGCSFTEGGGLDNFDYYNYNTGLNYNIDNNIREEYEEVRLFKEDKRYSSIVGKLMGVKINNYAIGCNSNEGILKKVFEVLNDSDTTENDIFIVQTSFYSRKFYWYEPTEEFLSVNALEKEDWPYRNMEIWMPLHQLHNLNVKCAHNEQYEIDKLITNMQIYNSYFKEKGIKLFWTPWPDLTLEKFPTEINKFNNNLLQKIPNIIFYDRKSMGRYITDNELQIRDDFKESMDSHKSLKGHEMIANKIVEFLKKKL
jgi:hypothetical protein